MHDMMLRLTPLPFAPTVVWGTGSGLVGIGLGDLILAATFPLVMYKAFSHRAGLLALLLMPCVIAGMILLQIIMPFKGVFPAMVFIGPTMILQYFFWHRHYQQERTMWQYYERKAGLPQF